mmetsp:Transcript_35835/g.96341  ORF Transcript_35835/g.96341 Transcript_35835/m.96341 type:complete len:247 (-) Transcript_35835:291-1031(-)
MAAMRISQESTTSDSDRCSACFFSSDLCSSRTSAATASRCSTARSRSSACSVVCWEMAALTCCHSSLRFSESFSMCERARSIRFLSDSRRADSAAMRRSLRSAASARASSLSWSRACTRSRACSAMDSRSLISIRRVCASPSICRSAAATSSSCLVIASLSSWMVTSRAPASSNCLKYDLARFGNEVTIRLPAKDLTSGKPWAVTGACTQRLHFPKPSFSSTSTDISLSAMVSSPVIPTSTLPWAT